MVLAAVKTASEELCSLEQLPREHTEMTDVIICPEIVGGKVRFEVQRYHIVDAVALKGGLITVNVIRSLLIYHSHILIQCGRMQDIVLIEQADILSGSKLQALVCIAGDPSVPVEFAVDDPAVCACGILPADLPDIAVRLVGAVRQTQLPVLIRLVHHGIEHLDLEFPLVVPQGYQNADLYHAVKLRTPLLLCLLRRRKARRAVNFFCLRLDLLLL
jgi:hypothetical protein